MRHCVRTRTNRTALFFVAVLALLPACGAHAQQLPAHTPDANIDRSAVPAVYRWDVTAIFADDTAWESARVQTAADVEKLAAFQGKLGEPTELLACLTLYFRVHNDANHVATYANLLRDTAETNETYLAMAKQGVALLDELMQRASFMRGEILALPSEAMQQAYEQVPELSAYRGYIDNMRRRAARVLDPDSERILGIFGDNLWAEIDLNEIPSGAEDTFSGLLSDIAYPTIKDAEGKEVQLTLSNYGFYRQVPQRAVREAAYHAVMGTLRRYQHALASTLTGQAKFDVALARARNYDTALEAYLDKDDIAPAVYHNLIGAVNANLGPLHRYVALRKKAMGLDTLHRYDLYVPLVESVEQTVPFEQARETILAALAPLGDAYVEVLAQGLDPANGWVDVFPHADKSSGAYCVAVYGLHPFVLMNYQDTFYDMSVLAHEFGHALHYHLSSSKQGYPDFRYPAFLAEIASTANEALLNEYLVSKAEDPKVRAMLLTERLESMRTTIYRQTLFAEFELAVHTFVEQGTPVTAELLEQTYRELLQRYYGPELVLDADDGMEWAYIPHFYWKYYVFNYATGLSSGLAIAELVKNDPKARDAYLGMLEAGSTAPPLEILAGAGVDLTEPRAIEAALERFDATVQELDALLAGP